jgi:CheY-like chemotaxis protein
MGALSADFAHYFNNILTLVTCNCELLLDAIDKTEQRGQLIEIAGAARNATGVLTDLLAFSRKQPLSNEPVDISSVVEDTLRFLKQLIPNNITVREEFDEGADPVIADADLLRQCVINLVINSKEALPEGGTIRVKVGSETLDRNEAMKLDGIGEGLYTKIEVSDDGVGIAPDDLNSVFQPFFTTKGKDKNAGVGLAMVYGFIKQIGGGIRIQGEVGKGTTVALLLPSAWQLSPEWKDECSVGKELAGSECILVVEDDPSVLELTKRALKNYGYKVIATSNGVEALEACKKPNLNIDLIIADVVMPEMGGTELARKLNEMELTIPLLFTSGYSAETLGDQSLLSPGVNFICKPYSPTQLCRVVRRLLDQKG